MILNPLFHTDCSISDSLKSVRKSVLIYETIILELLAELKTRCNVPWMYQNTVDDDRYLYYLHSIYSNDKH